MGRQVKELIAGKWRRLRTAIGQRTRCILDCLCIPADPCNPQDEVIFNLCGDGLVDCITAMGGQVAVTFQDAVHPVDPEVTCHWSYLDGTYPLPDFNDWQGQVDAIGCPAFFYFNGDCAPIAWGPLFLTVSYQCFEGEGDDPDYLRVTAKLQGTGTDRIVDEVPAFEAYEDFPLPLAVGHNLTFNLTNLGNTTGTHYCAPTDSDIGFPILTSCTVTLKGLPCEEPDCTLGPTAQANIERGPFDPDAEVNLIDVCNALEPEVTAQFYHNACQFQVTDTSFSGRCNLERVILKWPGGRQEIEPGSTHFIRLFDGCGNSGDLVIQIIAIDTLGCYDTAEYTLSCCGCCTPSGGFSINLDDNVDGIDASNCDQPTDLAPDPCCSWGHQWCYYSVHFDPVDVGECSAGGLYLVDWGCIQARDGGAPDICVEPGAEGADVRVRVDAGCYGQCCCLGVTAVNYEGCAAETTYSDSLIGNAFCMAREDYDLIDPEVYGDCYPLLIPYDCPPVDS